MNRKSTYKRIERMGPDEVERLHNSEFYPARTLAAAFGFADLKPILRDYDDGIIDLRQCRTTGRGAIPGQRMKRRRLGLEIRGREIKRIALREGRIPPSAYVA